MSGRNLDRGGLGAYQWLRGALVVVAYEALDLAQQAAIPVVSVVVAVIALGVRRDGWRAGDVPIGPTAAERSAARAVPWSAVLVLGAAVVAYFVVDSAAQIWSTNCSWWTTI